MKFHHIDYFKETLLPMLKRRFSVTLIWDGLYKIERKNKAVFYDYNKAHLTIGDKGKPQNCGVDQVYNRIDSYLK